MDEIENFFRELFRINADIYDAKYEKYWVNIKWSVAYKQILQVNICVPRLSQHELGPFFAVIWAVMDEIQNFFRELFRIIVDIYDTKYEMNPIIIKWSRA